VVPFLKVANDTAVAVNQGGKRKGAMCAYLETWHMDIEEFLELRKNTGDDRRRTHDMNTANWVPDLFMKRVVEDGQWTLFSPDEVPDLHDLIRPEFETQVRAAYEEMAERGQIRNFKRLRAVTCGARCSRCCSRPAIPGSPSRTPATCARPSSMWAWCTAPTCAPRSPSTPAPARDRRVQPGLGQSAQHITDGQLDEAKLARTVSTAMRMLDNVIDINYYSVPTARAANLRHRPVGLGIMGFPGLPVPAAHPLRQRSRGGVRRRSAWKR
jgi:ribonucleoside-diphosphate reductase alpha chain